MIKHNITSPTVYKDAFSKDIIKSLKDNISNIPYSLNGGVFDYKTNEPLIDKNFSRRIYNIENNDKTLPFFITLKKYINQVNDKYKFNIQEINNVLYCSFPLGSKLQWHLDVGPDSNINRKISFTIFCNDNYKGGELQFYLSDLEKITFPALKGTIIFFPSFLLHRVTSILEGTRDVIIGFIEGEPFK